MDDQIRDDFLDDATHAVNELWEKVGGERLPLEDLYSLNDLLTSFFAHRGSRKAHRENKS